LRLIGGCRKFCRGLPCKSVSSHRKLFPLPVAPEQHFGRRSGPFGLWAVLACPSADVWACHGRAVPRFVTRYPRLSHSACWSGTSQSGPHILFRARNLASAFGSQSIMARPRSLEVSFPPEPVLRLRQLLAAHPRRPERQRPRPPMPRPIG